MADKEKIINDDGILKIIFSDRVNAGAVAKGVEELQRAGYVLVESMNDRDQSRLGAIHSRYLMHSDIVDNAWESDVRWMFAKIVERPLESHIE